MTTIIKRPGRAAFIREISNTLTALQDLVGGYIETLTLGGGIVMIVNEEGKILGLPLNFRLGSDSIRGTAVFVSVDGDDFCGLNKAQQSAILRRL